MPTRLALSKEYARTGAKITQKIGRRNVLGKIATRASNA